MEYMTKYILVCLFSVHSVVAVVVASTVAGMSKWSCERGDVQRHLRTFLSTRRSAGDIPLTLLTFVEASRCMVPAVETMCVRNAITRLHSSFGIS